MKVLIMSDTHFRSSFSLDNSVLEHIAESDMIIHCGDFTGIEFYRFLNSTGKLIAVRGNNDRLLHDILPAEKSFNIGRFSAALTHGHIISPQTIHMKYHDKDIIIHGHSHHPQIEKYNGRLILNPGSLTMNRYTDKNSYMILNINEDEEPQAEIFYLN